jgi:hypothetical protein
MYGSYHSAAGGQHLLGFKGGGSSLNTPLDRHPPALPVPCPPASAVLSVTPAGPHSAPDAGPLLQQSAPSLAVLRMLHWEVQPAAHSSSSTRKQQLELEQVRNHLCQER